MSSSLFSLAGKTALVTGAAQGLGQGIALAFAEAGADIAAVSLNTSQETVNAAKAFGVKAVSIESDLSDHSNLQNTFDQALELTGHVDILVNCAGMIRRTPAKDHSEKDWFDVINLNLNTVFLLSQIAGRHFLERGSGKIINIASMLSYQGGINVPGYTASKHGVAGLTKAFANEWAGSGLNINAIAPGYMATENTAPIRADQSRSDAILDRIPAARWGTPDDLRGPAVFLASAASDYLNGHILNVDGGWMAR
ncbi:2-deoxy-D-gluconate 3-dehydrogenase [Paenibacillus sp. PastF-3]|jgi:2-deoxy-D-gluconate 3-dehydrogenase|uniref:2-dehydro-3-deoxy-D-gluconate 5-dehydrogenase KduD n=1 Tax=Paenibacillus TaxID=44249 RepID=UPI000BA12892|nr:MULTISPECIES: 2-dehydro-3-deoxy-D-gluconate 5-dehydrogenase KduD [unclassified Paenibacillus]MDH6369059.1 2-deoxy-D-gluconate 3-dehydrogenase [Paenibacillus sp. PastF-3]OZQ81513.1 2-deoxy-D-gluconate 3-dehydrogenase [Paenibacillus sp. VTT E-133291]